MDNYYKILGVENFASIEDIKEAYRKLSKKFHPDLNDGDKFFEEKFKELQFVYETLSDLDRRGVYDENLKRSIQNANLPTSSNNEIRRTAPILRPRRPALYVFEKGRYVKRRRL